MATSIGVRPSRAGSQRALSLYRDLVQSPAPTLDPCLLSPGGLWRAIL